MVTLLAATYLPKFVRLAHRDGRFGRWLVLVRMVVLMVGFDGRFGLVVIQ
jgi:hypothetical protein